MPNKSNEDVIGQSVSWLHEHTWIEDEYYLHKVNHDRRFSTENVPVKVCRICGDIALDVEEILPA